MTKQSSVWLEWDGAARGAARERISHLVSRHIKAEFHVAKGEGAARGREYHS